MDIDEIAVEAEVSPPPPVPMNIEGIAIKTEPTLESLGIYISDHHLDPDDPFLLMLNDPVFCHISTTPPPISPIQPEPCFPTCPPGPGQESRDTSLEKALDVLTQATRAEVIIHYMSGRSLVPDPRPGSPLPFSIDLTVPREEWVQARVPLKPAKGTKKKGPTRALVLRPLGTMSMTRCGHPNCPAIYNHWVEGGGEGSPLAWKCPLHVDQRAVKRVAEPPIHAPAPEPPIKRFRTGLSSASRQKLQIESEDSGGLMSCHHCDQGFRSGQSLRRHLELVIFAEGTIRCCRCGSAFRLLANFFNHINKSRACSDTPEVSGAGGSTKPEPARARTFKSKSTMTKPKQKQKQKQKQKPKQKLSKFALSKWFESEAEDSSSCESLLDI